MSRRLFATSALRLPPTGIPVNAPPINTVPAAQTTFLDTAKLFSDVGGNQVKVGDVDTPIVTATLTASNGMTIAASPHQGVMISNNGTSKVLIVGSPENVNRAMNGMRIAPASGFSGTATVTLRTSDGLNVDEDSFSIVVSGTAPPPVAQAPQNYVPSTKTTGFQTALNLSSDNITVYDSDTENLSVTLTATNGTISVSAAAGSATITGNTTALMTISGPQVQINAALATLIFQPTPAYSGPASIRLVTSDGVLTDTDTIAITVQSSPVALGPTLSVGAPLQSVFSVSSNPGVKYHFYNAGAGNDRRVQLAAAYKPNLQVTMSSNRGVFTSDDQGTGPTILADGLPSRATGGYWYGAGGQNIKNIHTDYNFISLVMMRNSGNGTDNGAVSWPWPGWPSPADVQFVRARGQKIILVIGWQGFGFNYTTRAQSNNLLNSIIPFINSLGGVDGIDFRNYIGNLIGYNLSTEAIYIVQQLRVIFGPTFMIVYTYDVIDSYISGHRALAKALNDAGCLTLCQGLYIEWAGFKVAGACSSRGLDFAAQTGIPYSKMMLSFTTNYNYTDNLTVAECTREVTTCKNTQPTWRGASVYSTELDGAFYWDWIGYIRNQALGFWETYRGRSTITGAGTKTIVFTGNMQQINYSLDSMYYDADDYYLGGDTITVVATDGTLSDTKTMSVNIPPG